MEKPIKSFIKDFKISKSLKDDLVEFGEGDQISMFSNVYKVMSPKGADQVILRDNKDIMFSMHKKKLAVLMKKNAAQMLFKSAPGSAATPKAPSSGGGQGKGKIAPLNTVHNGRMKVQMNPPKWVDVQSGQAHNHHSGDDKHAHAQDLELEHAVQEKITLNTPAGDHEKLKQLTGEYIEKRRALKNLHSVNRGMSQGGSNSPSSFKAQAHAVADKAHAAKKALVEAYKEAVHKKKSGE